MSGVTKLILLRRFFGSGFTFASLLNYVEGGLMFYACAIYAGCLHMQYFAQE